ncbi:hypothetical protein J7337_006822 [Fusarium musae]|uniref:Uncharacterized protein n=1 Tax=Fusarium musae TaxID=1042133 RepID=A0A9P8DFW6_9HYPO|nr:hypothetical protein J7337_006822 [Fusarium musae]KAG9501138.1 hypothetical protein J7337_006822 [Fusarium musae]
MCPKPCRVRAPNLRVDPGLVDIFLIPDRRIGILVDTDETLQLSTNAAAKADLRKMITALSAPDSIGPLSGPADTYEQRRIGFEQYRAGSDPEDRRAEL